MNCIYLQFFAINLVTKSAGGASLCTGRRLSLGVGASTTQSPEPYPNYKTTVN